MRKINILIASLAIALAPLAQAGDSCCPKADKASGCPASKQCCPANKGDGNKSGAEKSKDAGKEKDSSKGKEKA